jgi:4-amino-4-deoxy-L-arabinose transferase-like glycosyltransferase
MRRGGWLLLAMLLPRLLVWPFNENVAGDAVVRVWLAEAWLQSPHVIGSFEQGARQFGPLHLYLLALLEWLWPVPEHAGRLLSLVVGVATAWPLWALSRRLFDETSAIVAVLCLSFWGFHVQLSTTGASEALSLLLVTSTVAGLARWQALGERASLLGAGLALTLACATRYDAWLLVPLLGLWVWRVGGARAGLAFGAAALAFVVPWCFGNWVDLGDALFPFRFIDAFHRAWYPSEEAIWGAGRYQLMAAVFWPGVALVTLTPLLAVPGLLGLVASWRTSPGARWLVGLIVLPALAYTVRATVLRSFVPLARFTSKEVLLLLPFVWCGAQRVAGVRARGLVAAGLVGLVAWSSWLGVFTFGTEGAWPDTLRAISPTSTNDVAVRNAARALQAAHPGAEELLVVDEPPSGYDDVQVAFASGFPHSARVRSVRFEAQRGAGCVTWLVLFDGGRLEREGRARRTNEGFDAFGARFRVVVKHGPMTLCRRLE